MEAKNSLSPVRRHRRMRKWVYCERCCGPNPGYEAGPGIWVALPPVLCAACDGQGVPRWLAPVGTILRAMPESWVDVGRRIANRAKVPARTLILRMQQGQG